MKKIKRKVKHIFKNKSPFLIANIILILIILFIVFIFLSDFFNDNLEDRKLNTEYYNENYYSDNIDSNIIPETANANTDDIKNVTKEEENPLLNIKKGLYAKVIDSCSEHFGGNCVRARACPSLNCPVVTSLRNNIVLKISGETTTSDGIVWQKIIFDEWRRYDDRLPSEFYVANDYLEIIESQKETYKKGVNEKNKTNKKIIIDRSEQKLYAYEDDELFMEISISTGLESLPTPRGTFQIFEKTPSRYMQGPLPNISDDYYDLPGVPWTMYFTSGGAAIHGAYWHNNFGVPWSHGCVNLRPIDAEMLYNWAPIGTTVVVRD